MKVYVVSGNVSYEGGTVLEVFTTEIAAGSFILSCAEHDEMEPEMPDSDAGVQLWLEYDAVYKQWKDHHPAKRTFYDSYSFEMFTLRES